MRRLKTFLRQQRRAWAMLFAPAPKPFAWPEVTGDEHPSELCRCTGHQISQSTAAQAVDHQAGCPVARGNVPDLSRRRHMLDTRR